MQILKSKNFSKFFELWSKSSKLEFISSFFSLFAVVFLLFFNQHWNDLGESQMRYFEGISGSLSSKIFQFVRLERVAAKACPGPRKWT